MGMHLEYCLGKLWRYDWAGRGGGLLQSGNHVKDGRRKIGRHHFPRLDKRDGGRHHDRGR